MPQKEILKIEEINALKELQDRMKNVLPPNYYNDSSLFYRFLKARDFDVDKAEKMLRKNIIWRKAFQIDTILEDFKPKEVFQKCVGPNCLGLDKDGDLVVYVAIGKIESKDILKCMTIHDMVKHVVWIGENYFPFLTNCDPKTAEHNLQVVLIFDLEDLTFSNTTAKASLDTMLRLTHITQDNYPERLKSVKIINAPSYYVIAFAILKAVMSSLMVNKIRIFSQSGWKEHFSELIDADTLPAFLGGNRTDPDGNPRCTTFMAHGGKPSPNYILSKEDRYFTNVQLVKMLIIPPMEKREIYIEVTESGSRLEWEFLVRGKDIKFGLSLQRTGDDVEEILPEGRYFTTDGAEKGFYKCQSTGKYIIIFDNSYSWLSSKEVEYCFTVKNDESYNHKL